jgi:hypothetical protein
LGQTGTLEIVVITDWNSTTPIYAVVVDPQNGQIRSVYLWPYYYGFRGIVQLPMNRPYDIHVLYFQRTVWLSQSWQQEVFS